MKTDHMGLRLVVRAAVLAGMLLAAACQPIQAPLSATAQPAPAAEIESAAATAVPAVEPTQVPAPEPTGIADGEAVTLTLGAPLTGSVVISATERVSAAVAFTTATPVQSGPPVPVRLQIAALGLDVPVVEMGWEVVGRGAQRTTRWVLPEDAAGWHVTSARAGSDGNVLISGSQLAGAAVFAPLALGEVEAGQDVVVTDSSGVAFLYRVREVSEPLSLRPGDAVAEQALANYLADDGTGRLTLVTGWPDFTTTHRLVVVADLVGPAD